MAKLFVKKLPPIEFTPTGYDELLAKRKKLLSQRPQAVSNLREAREMGDLSENGYYKEARARLSFIDGRVRHFDRLLKQAKVIKKVNLGVVGIGSQVTIKSKTKYAIYTIVGGYESNPAKGAISHRSPLGQSLLGKKINQKVIVHTPSGDINYTIKKIV